MSTGNSPDSLDAARGRLPLGLIAGPTASGKSDLAVRLALALEAAGKRVCVINADSAQLYADLPVLSAAPSAADCEAVRHELYGAWDGAVACSAADWAGRAKAAIADAHGAGVVPILVGGTGLYIRTLLEGIAPVPEIDPEVRARVRAMPVGEAYAALMAADESRAAMLGARDVARVARALEVVWSSGKSLGFWQKQMVGGIGGEVSLAPLVLLPEREWLYERCDRRFGLMMAGGAVEEVAALLARGLDPDLPVMRAIGVAEIAAMLRGEISPEDAAARGAQATRNYAKRQYTWLRHQPPVEWARFTGRLDESFDMPVNFVSLFRE